MNKSYKLILFIVLTALIVLFLLKKGFENKVDPLWDDINNFISADITLLSEKEDELQRVYDSIHPNSKENVFTLIGKPFLPIMSWNKFNGLLKKVIQEKKVVVIGVSGTGKSTIIDRVALIITGKEKNITNITCVEGLERDYNEQWIGHYDKNGFIPGKLLELFNECEKNDTQNYVLIIDDFDKVHRSTFFGATIWNELDNKSYKNVIRGYKEISIPDNLYIISTAQHATTNKIPLTSEDFRRLTNGNPYILEPDLTELKEYIQTHKDTARLQEEKDSLLHQLYYFSKINSVIEQKIGKSAVIGQWSGIQKLLKKSNYDLANDFVSSHIAKFEYKDRLSEDDFNDINYTLHNKGKVRGTSSITSFFKKLVELGLVSELTVAILFALFSFISFRRTRLIRKKNIDNMLHDIQFIETKYLNNAIHYNNAYGNLLSINEDIQAMAKEGKLDFSQANYLTHQLKESLKVMDFVNGLGQNNDDLSNFMKVVLADDDITKEEYDDHIDFLRKNKDKIDAKTYHTVKQQLIKLYHKSNVKHGRI